MSLQESISELVPRVTGEMLVNADVEMLHDNIEYYIRSIKISKLRSLCLDILDDEPLFWTIPASSTHNTRVGGLAKHILEVLIYANNMYAYCLNKEVLSRDLIIAGACLHDIGKVRLVGEKLTIENHIAKDIEIVSGAICKYKFTQKEKEQLLGTIESHHTQFDTNIGPRFTTMEGYIVSVADKLSALFSITSEQIRNNEPLKCYYQTKLERSVF